MVKTQGQANWIPRARAPLTDEFMRLASSINRKPIAKPVQR